MVLYLPYCIAMPCDWQSRRPLLVEQYERSWLDLRRSTFEVGQDLTAAEYRASAVVIDDSRAVMKGGCAA